MNGMDKEELKQIYASTHTLRVEGDCRADDIDGDTYNFNPHPPRGG